MPIQLEKRGDVFILTPDFDGITDQAFAEMTAPDSVTLRDAYSSATKAVIFDLRNIDFIDSHGVGLMVGVRACSFTKLELRMLTSVRRRGHDRRRLLASYLPFAPSCRRAGRTIS